MFLASVIKIVTSVTLNDEQTHRYRHRDTSHLRMAVPKVKRILLFGWDSMMHKSPAGSLPGEDKNWIIGISLGYSHLASILFTCKSTVIQVPPETIWNAATAVPGAGSPGGGRRRANRPPSSSPSSFKNICLAVFLLLSVNVNIPSTRYNTESLCPVEIWRMDSFISLHKVLTTG